MSPKSTAELGYGAIRDGTIGDRSGGPSAQIIGAALLLYAQERVSASSGGASSENSPGPGKVLKIFARSLYSVSQTSPPRGFLTFFPKRLDIFRPNSTHILLVSIYAGEKIFIQLSAILTKLCYIKRDHPVHHVQMVHHRPNARWHFLTFLQTDRKLALAPLIMHCVHSSARIAGGLGGLNPPP